MSFYLYRIFFAVIQLNYCTLVCRNFCLCHSFIPVHGIRDVDHRHLPCRIFVSVAYVSNLNGAVIFSPDVGVVALIVYIYSGLAVRSCYLILLSVHRVCHGNGCFGRKLQNAVLYGNAAVCGNVKDSICCGFIGLSVQCFNGNTLL